MIGGLSSAAASLLLWSLWIDQDRSSSLSRLRIVPCHFTINPFAAGPGRTRFADSLSGG